MTTQDTGSRDTLGVDLAMLEGLDPSQLTPEQLEQLAALGALGDEQGELKDQIATAEALRYGKGQAEGRQTQNAYVAANPLEHLADALGKVQAAKDLEEYEQRQGDIRQEQTDGRNLFMQMIMGEALKKGKEKEVIDFNNPIQL